MTRLFHHLLLDSGLGRNDAIHGRSTRACLSAMLASACLLLTGCGGEEKIGVSYGGVNHTDKNIVSIVINDQGGVLDVIAHGGGAPETCCVVIPKKWRPGLIVSIEWQEDATPVRDKQGHRVYKDGVPVLIEAPWKKRTVEIPEYKEVGDFYVHFLPGDVVKVYVSRVMPAHPNYPFHLPNERAGQ